MDNARIQGGANYIEPKKPEQYVGKGIRGMIMEGIYATHTEFAAISPYRTAPLYIGSSSASGHGNSTCGEVFARGVNKKARGLCPYGQIIYCNYNYVYNNNNRYTVVKDLVDPSKQYKGMFQTVTSKDSRFRKRGFKLENVFAGPVSTALLFNSYGADHEEFMRNYTRVTCAEVAVRDENVGQLAIQGTRTPPSV